MTTFLVTGASGQLGQIVIDHLSTLVPKSDIVALVRSDESASFYEGKGISVRRGDYDDVASLRSAFEGVDRLLLISSSEIGKRATQHANVIEAAKSNGVGFIAYTSILNATENPMALADEHKTTENLLGESGIPHTVLRNGWYLENLLMAMPQSLQTGQYFGAAGEGLFSAASRKDFGEAAAIVLAGGHDRQILELVGDSAFTLADFVAEIASVSGKQVTYVNLAEHELKTGLVQAGLPEPFAAILAESDAKAANGSLHSDSKKLSELIGHPTASYNQIIAAALA
jgi:NAD(P)H dehydrogenase (quinone)